jgi:hypothetical protein
MSFDFMKEMITGGSRCLFSVANSVLPHLWHVLSANLPDKHWCTAVNNEGWLAAVHCICDEKDSTKVTYILSFISHSLFFFFD